tara:strand:- start:3125 stop:4369 length:1245 start_codon:yes stop_codon:yes gene_type:complete
MPIEKIVICDDELKRTERWANRLGALEAVASRYEIVIATPDDIGKAYKELEERREALRSDPKIQFEGNLFDSANILVLDQDLLHLESEGKYAVGNELAYLARVFSGAGFITVLNEFGIRNFDLSLVEDAMARADINVGSDHLDNPGLWTEPFEGFRPWHWPVIPKAASTFQQRVKEVQEALDEPVFGFFGFEERELRQMSRSVLGVVMADKGDGTHSSGLETTFKDFVLYSHGAGMNSRDAKAIETRPDIIARVAAARSAKWLERQVVVSQDVLVDAPHLVSRMPFLMTGDHSKISDWNRTTAFEGELLIDGSIEKYRFERPDWLYRPAFWWNRIEDSEEIQALMEKWDGMPCPFVFREDTSSFGTEENSLEFVAEVPSVFDRRYVSNPDTDEFGDDNHSPKKVTHTDSHRLAM